MKNQLSRLLAAGICAAGLFTTNLTARADIFDPFNIPNIGWVADRYQPAYFGPTNFDGGRRLGIVVDDSGAAANRPPSFSSSFYDTQGRQRSITGMAPGSWFASISLYVSTEMATGIAGPLRPELWVSTIGGNFFLLGLLSGTSDPYAVNPITSASWETFDDSLGIFTTSSIPVVSGWNTLGVSYDGTTLNYSINGVSIATLTPDPLTASDPSVVYLQNRNFGVGYGNTVFYDNLNVISVPEPATTSMLILGTLNLFGLQHRHRKNRSLR